MTFSPAIGAICGVLTIFELGPRCSLAKLLIHPHIHVVTFILLARAASQESIMAKFNYAAPAELFPSRNRKIANKVKYRRFDRAADAIRFAIEELPAPLLLGAFIEIDEERLGHKDIIALYESENYPLKRAS